MSKTKQSQGRAIRTIGVLFGIFLIIPPIDSEIRDPTIGSVVYQLFLTLLGCLLIIPWSKITSRAFKITALIIYICCAIGFTTLMIKSCVWAISEGKNLQKWAFSIFTILEGLILLSQIPVMKKINLSIRDRTSHRLLIFTHKFDVTQTKPPDILTA